MKIFGVGLSKTGTKSLTQAFRILGYESIHFVRMLWFDRRNNLRFRIEEGVDTFTDSPVARFYKTVNINNKFILTTRDVNDWLASCKKFFYKNRFKGNPKINQLHMELYGCLEYDEKKFRRTYFNHHKDVNDYFDRHNKEYLIMDICKGDGWEKLCPFLGRDIPDVPFPSIPDLKNFKECLLPS